MLASIVLDIFHWKISFLKERLYESRKEAVREKEGYGEGEGDGVDKNYAFCKHEYATMNPTLLHN